MNLKILMTTHNKNLSVPEKINTIFRQRNGSDKV